MTVTRYDVPDMHCPACVMHLEGIEDDLPGIRTIQANFRRQELIVDYDESRVSEAQICAAAGEMGYVLVRRPE